MELMAEDMPLDIIFESPDFAIVNKDAGINTHPTPGEGGRRGTLVNALLYHFQTLGVRHERGDGDDENGGEYVDENGEIPTHPSIIN